MDGTYWYQLGDVYMATAPSFAFVITFVYLKCCNLQLKPLLLQFLLAGWALLEVAALVLSAIYDFSPAQLPQGLGRSLHLILITVSICGLINV